MSSSPPTSFQSINVSLNGVVKNLIIPMNSLPAATRVPRCPITVQPTQDVVISVQPSQTTVVSSIPSPQILAFDPPKNGQQAADPAVSGSGAHPKLTSILSTVRFQAGGHRTLLAIRPKGSSAATAATTASEAGKAATVARPMTAGSAGELYSPVVRALRPGMKINAVPVSGGAGETGVNISIIRPAQLVRPVSSGSVIRQPGTSTAGNQRFQYVIQPGVRQVLPPGLCRPKTIMVKGVSDRNAKKMVMIRVPGGGSSDTRAAQNALQLKPGYAWVEVKDSRSNTVRYIQMRKKEPGKTLEAEPLPRAATPPPASEEPPSMADDMASEDIKVIEIVPDEDDEDEEDLEKPSEMPEKSEEEEKPTDGTDIFKLPLPVIGHPDPLPNNQDFDNSDSNPGSPRQGIFETLKNMSLEEATTAASALKIPTQGHQEQEDFTTADGSSMNIVLRGDDHMVIENPKYSDDEDDDEDDDDDECTVSAEEPSHDSDMTISEPHSLAASPLKPVQAKFPAGLAIRGFPGKNQGPSRTESKRRNVARRTGGRPGVPQECTARRSSGRPMTIKERYGVDVMECHVLLDRKVTSSPKPYTKWAEQNLGRILCRIKKRAIKKSETVKIGTEGSRPLKRSETDEEVGQTIVFKEPNDEKIGIEDYSYVNALTSVASGRKRDAEKLKLAMSDSAIEFGGTEIDMGPIVVRKRTPRQKVKTDVNLEQTEDTEVIKADNERSVEQNPEPGPAKRRRVWSRKKLLTDGEIFRLNASLQVEGEVVPTGSTSNTSSGVNRRRARKPKGELLDVANQDGDTVDGGYPPKPRRRRRAKRLSETVGLGQDQSEFSTPMGAEASNEDESGAKKRRRRRRESNPESQSASFVTVGALDEVRSSVLEAAREDLRRKIYMKKSLLKPVMPVTSFSPATNSSRQNINTTGSRLFSAPTSLLPVRGSLVTTGETKSLTPTGPRANLDQTKYYLVKTQKGSFLIPVPGTSSNQNPMSMAVSVPAPPAATPSLPKSPADEGAAAASEEQSKSDSEDGGNYEAAVAGMRQEDRISLLKEKLRQQQALLAKLKKQ